VAPHRTWMNTCARDNNSHIRTALTGTGVVLRSRRGVSVEGSTGRSEHDKEQKSEHSGDVRVYCS
jgi:hypothetical protein